MLSENLSRQEGSAAAPALSEGLCIKQVARREGVSTSTIRRWVREGHFPRPIKRAGLRGKCVWDSHVLAAL